MDNFKQYIFFIRNLFVYLCIISSLLIVSLFIVCCTCVQHSKKIKSVFFIIQKMSQIGKGSIMSFTEKMSSVDRTNKKVNYFLTHKTQKKCKTKNTLN